MKKVLLVNSNTESAPYPVAPLGLCMLSTALEKAGFEVKTFDGLWYKNSRGTEKNSLTAVLHDFQPELIGVSVRNIDDVIMETATFYVDEVERLCISPIRKYNKGITVLGGAGFSLFPEELMDRWQFDYGIVGPGEKSLLRLIEAIKCKQSPENIPGVLAGKNGKHRKGSFQKQTLPKTNMLKLPDPQIDRQLDYEPYLSRSAYPIQTKRGCALKCLYCSYPTIEGKSYQLRTAKDVVDELERVSLRLPNTVIEFVDSTFNHPIGHAENICKEIIQRGLTLRLRTMGVNPSGVTHELIDLMKKAGFAQIDCTPDSASDKMLTNLRKGFKREKLKKTVQILKEADMPTMWFFVLGGPGEDEDTLKETFKFIHNFIDERDLVHITEGLRIYPNTGLAEVALKEGLINADESLLTPRFYVTKLLGKEKLAKCVKDFTAKHHNCLRSVDSSPSKEMIQEAIEVRKVENLTEPMFRTLLRLRKETFYP